MPESGKYGVTAGNSTTLAVRPAIAPRGPSFPHFLHSSKSVELHRNCPVNLQAATLAPSYADSVCKLRTYYVQIGELTP